MLGCADNVAALYAQCVEFKPTAAEKAQAMRDFSGAYEISLG